MSEKVQLENPRMTNPDGVYASEARQEDYVSLLDHFAGLAMQAEISRQSPGGRVYFEALVDSAYSYAEAMLIERKKRLNP